MIVFVHLENEVSQLLSFLVSIPDATDASSRKLHYLGPQCSERRDVGEEEKDMERDDFAEVSEILI